MIVFSMLRKNKKKKKEFLTVLESDVFLYFTNTCCENIFVKLHCSKMFLQVQNLLSPQKITIHIYVPISSLSLESHHETEGNGVKQRNFHSCSPNFENLNEK